MAAERVRSGFKTSIFTFLLSHKPKIITGNTDRKIKIADIVKHFFFVRHFDINFPALSPASRFAVQLTRVIG